MSGTLGHLCIVLHGHLPFVLNHGTSPHGEAWLYEAAAETYLPLLDMIGEAALNRARPGLTIGLTPVLLEQLAHPRFKEGFVAYLKERQERAGNDRKEFEASGQPHLAMLAERWEAWYVANLERFERIGQDIGGEFAKRCREGHIQILTSNATHAYMPLLLNDEMIQAQLACGKETSRKHLGFDPKGMWLPECAYRPECEQWMPPVLYSDARYRPGLELFVGEVGITHFFVDTHLIRDAMPLGIVQNGRFSTIAESRMDWGRERGWGSVLEPAGVVSKTAAPEVWALARHPQVSEQVWSGMIGYPGAGEYLDFHRKHGERGLRYHRVTNVRTPLSEKEPYDPEPAKGRLFEQAGHFCDAVRRVLKEYRDRTGRTGTVVAPFDAELFGHWWFEGIAFLREVILTLNASEDVKLCTAQEALALNPQDKVVRMHEGSWGEHGNHSVWSNDRNRWMWEIEYRCEGSLLKALYELPWRKSAKVREALERAARQLLLLQASDWPFVVHTQGAMDYGIQRFAEHSTNFDRALEMAGCLARGQKLSELQKVERVSMDQHDSVFSDIDLNWWIRHGH
jgi:1,4-alpha-glucan branching enzyme